MNVSVIEFRNSSAFPDSTSVTRSTGTPRVVQDSLAPSETLLGVVKNQIDFTANVTNEIVQSVTPRPSFSSYGL
jgi:hypothetical protein